MSISQTEYTYSKVKLHVHKCFHTKIGRKTIFRHVFAVRMHAVDATSLHHIGLDGSFGRWVKWWSGVLQKKGFKLEGMKFGNCNDAIQLVLICGLKVVWGPVTLIALWILWTCRHSSPHEGSIFFDSKPPIKLFKPWWRSSCNPYKTKVQTGNIHSKEVYVVMAVMSSWSWNARFWRGLSTVVTSCTKKLRLTFPWQNPRWKKTYHPLLLRPSPPKSTQNTAP